MYDFFKLLQPVAEEIGTVTSCSCKLWDRKYYSSDEIKITGTTNDGRPFELVLEVHDGNS